MLTFNGQAILGTHGAVRCMAPEARSVDTPFAGLDGVSEIRLGRGLHVLEFPQVWIYDANQLRTDAAVREYLKQLDDLVQTHGTLVETVTGTETWEHCTFLGFERQDDVRPDVGGMLGGGYWTRGVLRWKQLLATTPRGRVFGGTARTF